MIGRAPPSPRRRAYRLALPGRGSKICASIPSRASTALSHSAVLSSFPGGLVVLMATYCDNSAAASRPTARHSASLRGTTGSPKRGGRNTGWLEGPSSPGWGAIACGGRAQATASSDTRNREQRTSPPDGAGEPANYRTAGRGASPRARTSMHRNRRLARLTLARRTQHRRPDGAGPSQRERTPAKRLKLDLGAVRGEPRYRPVVQEIACGISQLGAEVQAVPYRRGHRCGYDRDRGHRR